MEKYYELVRVPSHIANEESVLLLAWYVEDGEFVEKDETICVLETSKAAMDIPAVVSGWVHKWRDHGGVIFIDLRDREGITQVVFGSEEGDASSSAIASEAAGLRNEWVISVKGKVSARPEGTINKKLDTIINQ